MKKILNPYPKYPGYNCFGCSPKNENGLKMDFFEDGESIVSNWKPIDFLQGYYNVLHGGIQATLMDEIGSWYIQVKLKTAGVTSNIKVRYLHPVPTNKGNIMLCATLVNKRRNLIDILVQLFDSTDKLCAKAEITYFTFSKEVAEKEYYYPNNSEFFEK